MTAHEAHLIGGPLDGAVYAIPQDTWEKGIFWYQDPPEIAVACESPAETRIPASRRSYYYRDAYHEQNWLHESIYGRNPE